VELVGGAAKKKVTIRTEEWTPMLNAKALHTLLGRGPSHELGNLLGTAIVPSIPHLSAANKDINHSGFSHVVRANLPV
jgi:hypothetical protein